VYFHNEIVGEYKLDMLVEGEVVAEFKACKAIVDDHIAQALNYLAATRLRPAIIINFGPNGLETRRVVR
jgi:GxxExxY protein